MLIEIFGYIDMLKIGYVIFVMFDSVVVFLIMCLDWVDNLVCFYVVKQIVNINKNDIEYDIVKLWNFFW